MRAWLWAAVLIVLAAAIGMACGGGGDGGAEPTPDRQTLEAMLNSITLKLEDLPGSFNVQQETFTDNEQAAVIDPEGPTKGKERAVEFLSLILDHPSGKRETKDRTNLVLSEISSSLPSSAVNAARERGQRKTLERVVEELRAEDGTEP